MRNTLELSGILLVVLLAALAFHAWLTEHDDRLRLQATIATQKQALDAADVREHDRAATLKDTLAEIATLKRHTQTPAQILGELPKYLPLPQPITLTSPRNAPPIAQQGTAQSGNSRCASKRGCAPPASPSTPTSSGNRSPSLESPTAFTQEASSGTDRRETATQTNQQVLPDSPSAQIPAADLKPLFDYVQDCRSCQVQLAAARQDSADNAAKLKAVTRERDAAVATAKGGTFWQRLHRNAWWFILGAGAGASAVCATGHCR
jgi:hypothetical protein